MSKRADPKRAARGTGHRPAADAKTTEIVKQEHDLTLAETIANELPEGLPRDVFVRACLELGGRMRDTDLQALRMMAWAIQRHAEAQEDIEANGMKVSGPFGNEIPNPMLKVARDEGAFYMKIADRYALTFLSRLQAGILQLAGESMLASLHNSMADAIVARLVSDDPTVVTIVERTCGHAGCGKVVTGRRRYCTTSHQKAAARARRRER